MWPPWIFFYFGVVLLEASKNVTQFEGKIKLRHINNQRLTKGGIFANFSGDSGKRQVGDSTEVFSSTNGYSEIHFQPIDESEKKAKFENDSLESQNERRKSQVSFIRHRKSRKNFIRGKKGKGHSQSQEYESGETEEPIIQNVKIKTDGPESSVEDFSDTKLYKIEYETSDLHSSGAPNLENKYDDVMQYEDYEENMKKSVKSGGSSNDVVTKFLRIVESQHLLGENCTKGTEFNLGEGVVDTYAQERFRLQAEATVNRANLYTRLWKYATEQVLVSEYLLHAELLSLVEFHEDIFGAGNCYDKYQYKDYVLFCPFAYRLPEGAILVKDLAVEYKYLTNTSEWFYRARKSAEMAISKYSQLTKGYHSYTWNESAHTERVEEVILSVAYEDGIWSKPYFDCGGGNIWMMTYTVPFFGYANGTYHFKGTSGIDIDLRRVDIDQCPLPPGSTALNIFANSAKCKKRTTRCHAVSGLGFRRGSYKCVCKDGFYFPDIEATAKYFNGSVIEEEYEKKLLGSWSLYDEKGRFECLPCAEGCETCTDASPCIVSLNWVMRTAILALGIIIICSLPAIATFTWKYRNVKVVRAASPVLLRIIILGAFFIYSTTLVLYPIPTMVTCSLRVWFREIGFSLAYGALMLKTWRISVIFRVRSAKAVKITDLDLMKRLGIIVGVFSAFLAIRTVVAPPKVIVSMTADDLKAFLCSTDWWDHSFTAMEMMFLVWGIRLCIVVRKAPSEFNESKFISMTIYNEFLLSLFLNVSMLFLHSPANPDLLYIIFFCHTQFTITLLLALIFGSKAYIVFRGEGKADIQSSLTKPMAAKFLQKPWGPNTNACVSTSSSGGMDADFQEEFKRIYLQLEALKERNIKKGNFGVVSKITAMQEAANNAAQALANAKKQELLQQSQGERKLSDGIVMKPQANSIVSSEGTPKLKAQNGNTISNRQSGRFDSPAPIVISSCSKSSLKTPGTSAQEELQIPSCKLSSNGSANLTLSEPTKDEGSVIEKSRQERRVASMLNLTTSSRDSLRMRRCTSAYCSGSGDATGPHCKPLWSQSQQGEADRSVDLSKVKSISSEEDTEISFRACRSYENLEDAISRSDSRQENQRDGEKSTRSAQSTPKHLSHFREIRDPERARAFILFNLSDRSSGTEEVTV